MWQKLKQIHFMFYVSLVFIIFPIAGALTGEYPLLFLLWTGIFVGAYAYILLIEEQPIRQKLAWLILCLYVVYASIWLNIGFVWYLFYLSNILTYRLSEHNLKSSLFSSFFIIQFLIIIGCGIVYKHNWEVYLNILIIIGFVDIITLGFRRMELIEDLREKQLKQNEQINLLLAESERNRIGRDLHDSLGHTFAMLSLKTELAQQFLQMNELERLGKELQEVHDISKQSMADVRRIIDNLKTRTLPEELATIEKMLEMTGLGVELTNELNIASLPQHLQASMSMILLEMATNIIKHAKAAHCRIRLHEESGQILLDVEDDGQGFKEVTGQELRSIRERLEALSGEIEILSSSQPTLIRVILPYGGGKS